MLSEHVLVPFTGGDHQAADFDTFNFFLSQLPIHILIWHLGCLPPNGLLFVGILKLS
jgi:hypothetical protein